MNAIIGVVKRVIGKGGTRTRTRERGSKRVRERQGEREEKRKVEQIEKAVCTDKLLV